MANSMNESAWDHFLQNMSAGEVLQTAFPSDAQPLGETAFSDPQGLTTSQDWFLSTEHDQVNLSTTVADSTQGPSSVKSPSTSFANDPLLTTQTGPQVYISPFEVVNVIQDMKKQLEELKDSVQDLKTKVEEVNGDYKTLLPWTLDMNKALSGLARQVVEKKRPHREELEEWSIDEIDGMEEQSDP